MVLRAPPAGRGAQALGTQQPGWGALAETSLLPLPPADTAK